MATPHLSFVMGSGTLTSPRFNQSIRGTSHRQSKQLSPIDSPRAGNETGRKVNASIDVKKNILTN